jgi:hypothetical protein
LKAHFSSEGLRPTGTPPKYAPVARQDVLTKTTAQPCSFDLKIDAAANSLTIDSWIDLDKHPHQTKLADWGTTRNAIKQIVQENPSITGTTYAVRSVAYASTIDVGAAEYFQSEGQRDALQKCAP